MSELENVSKVEIKCPRCLRYLFIHFMNDSQKIKIFCLCNKFHTEISLSSFP